MLDDVVYQNVINGFCVDMNGLIFSLCYGMGDVYQLSIGFVQLAKNTWFQREREIPEI